MSTTVAEMLILRRGIGLLLVLLLATACAVVDMSDQPRRIALLAPFEGRYREVGYEAYYAAQLALVDAGLDNVALLAVDDGGSPELAVKRAHALASNPAVLAVITLGYDATDLATLDAFNDLPIVVVGYWGVNEGTASTYLLSSNEIEDAVTVPARVTITDAARMDGAITGGDVLALREFAGLRDDLDGMTVLASGLLPNDEFKARIAAQFPFADEPGLLATLSYDAAGMLAEIASTAPDRTAIHAALGSIEYDGINPSIVFEDGRWRDAPLLRYAYDQDRHLFLEP